MGSVRIGQNGFRTCSYLGSSRLSDYSGIRRQGAGLAILRKCTDRQTDRQISDLVAALLLLVIMVLTVTIVSLPKWIR